MDNRKLPVQAEAMEYLLARSLLPIVFSLRRERSPRFPELYGPARLDLVCRRLWQGTCLQEVSQYASLLLFPCIFLCRFEKEFADHHVRGACASVKMVKQLIERFPPISPFLADFAGFDKLNVRSLTA
jgi:hypothetical protein